MAKNTVIVSVLGDTRDLHKKLGGAGSAFSKFGKIAAAGAAVAAAATVAIGTKAVKSASALQQNLGAMASVFKSSNSQMLKWAQGAASAVGLAKSEYAGLATVLGAQLKNMGVAQAQLGGQTNKLIGLGADLAAQFGGSTSDAVSALSSLLRGERDPIERYGVSINEAAVKAKMAEMGLAGLTGEAEKNAKLSATLALLYDQTADAQGAFARESTTLAGAQQRLAAGTENLYAILGTSLLPAVTAVTAAFGQMVNKLQESEWFQALTANLTAASNSFADFVFGILNGTSSLDFGALFSGLLPAAISGIQSAAAWLSAGGLTPILESIATGREGLLAAGISLFGAIADALPQIIPALVTGLLQFVRDAVTLLVDSVPAILDAAVQMFSGLVESLAVVLPDLVSQIATLLPTLVAALLGMIPSILASAITLFNSLVQAVVTIVPQLVTTITELLPTLIESILSMLPDILAAAVQLFMSIVQAIPTILPVLVTSLLELLPLLIENILAMLPGLLESAITLFTSLVEAIPVIIPLLIETILSLLPEIITTLIGMIPTLLDAAITLFTSLIESLPVILPDLVLAIIGLAPKLVSTIIGMVPKLLDAGVKLFTGLVTSIPKIIPKLLAAVKDLGPKMVNGIKDMIPRLLSAGGDLIAGLVRGIRNSAGQVGQTLLNIGKNAVSDFLGFFGIHSPSRLMAKYGKFLPQGVGVGITSGIGYAKRAMSRLSGAVSDSFAPTLSTVEIDAAFTGTGPGPRRPGGGPDDPAGAVITHRYEITVHAVAGGVETGRAIVEAIANYERVTGGKPA